MLTKCISNITKCYFSTPKSFYKSSVLDTSISLNDPILKQNKKSMDEVNNQYIDILQKNTIKHDQKLLSKLHKSGKLLVRERIQKLLDPGSPFLQFSPLAGYELYGKQQVNSGGIVTGVGLINVWKNLQSRSRYCCQQWYIIQLKCQKGANFVEICSQRKVPLIFLECVVEPIVQECFTCGQVLKLLLWVVNKLQEY